MRHSFTFRDRVVVSLVTLICGSLFSITQAADIGFLVDPDEVVDMPFDQFWVQRLRDQGHNVSILPANYQPDNPGSVTADIFIASNDIGSGDFISNPDISRQFNLNPIDLSGSNDVQVSVLAAASPEAGYDVDIDYLRFRADEDGDGSYETLLSEFLPNDFGELEEIGGEGTILEDLFQEVTFSVPNNISTLRLQVDTFNTAPEEQIGFDDIRVTAGGSTLATENFEGGAGQVGFTGVGLSVGNPNQFFNVSNADGVTPDVVFEDFEGDVWFGAADVDETFGFGATFRLTDSRPFITYEDAVFDELQMAPDPATGRSDGDVIVLVDGDHPLAAGLTADEFGEVPIFDSPQGITFIGPTDELAEAVHVIAENLDGQAVIAVLEKGDIGLDGEPSPGQRIGIFPQDGGNGSLYNDNGLALLDATVAYAIASTEPVDIPGDCNGDGVVDASDLSCACSAASPQDLLAQLGLIEGDLDGDGEVAFLDFLELAGNFGRTDVDYADGDINCDGEVAFTDFLTLAGNFGKTAAGEASSVPEPTGLFLLGISGLLIGMFRRRGR